MYVVRALEWVELLARPTAQPYILVSKLRLEVTVACSSYGMGRYAAIVKVPLLPVGTAMLGRKQISIAAIIYR